jgi:hypothetical protein
MAYNEKPFQRTPAFLLVIMVVWVLAPFAALSWATSISARWSVPIRWTLSVLSIVLSVASVAIYGEIVGISVCRPIRHDAGCDVAADGDRSHDGCRHLSEGIAPLTGDRAPVRRSRAPAAVAPQLLDVVVAFSRIARRADQTGIEFDSLLQAPPPRAAQTARD